MTEPSRERKMLQRGARIHLTDALGKAAGYVAAGERLSSIRSEVNGWLGGVDEAMLAFNQFRLSIDEVRRDTDLVEGNWTDAAWSVVTDRLEVVSGHTYGQETPEQARKRTTRNEMLALDDEALRQALDAKTASVADRLWRKGRAVVAEYLAS